MNGKITRATVKSFVKKNFDNLYLNVEGDFDGMVDCVVHCDGGFQPVKKDSRWNVQQHNLGIDGLYLCGDGMDYFKPYDDGNFTGIEYGNCCGCGIIAVKKAA